MDRRVSILRKRVGLTAAGDSVDSWEPIVFGRWAQLAPLQGEERFTGEQFVAMEQVEFRIRWSHDLAAVSPLCRIVEPALKLAELEGSPPSYVTDATITERRQYDVMAVLELGRRETLRILAARRVDVVELEELFA